MCNVLNEDNNDDDDRSNIKLNIKMIYNKENDANNDYFINDYYLNL